MSELIKTRFETNSKLATYCPVVYDENTGKVCAHISQYLFDSYVMLKTVEPQHVSDNLDLARQQLRDYKKALAEISDSHPVVVRREDEWQGWFQPLPKQEILAVIQNPIKDAPVLGIPPHWKNDYFG